MLGIICVPGAPRFTPLPPDDASALAFAFARSGNNPAETACAEAGPAVAAFSKAPRCESTLLTASGEICGAADGSPTPGVVVPSSEGTEAGGGPYSDARGLFVVGPAVCANGLTCEAGIGGAYWMDGPLPGADPGPEPDAAGT